MLQKWPWPWYNDLGTQNLPRYGQDVPPYQKWSFYVKAFKSFSLYRQADIHTHTQTQYENITFLHTRAVIKLIGTMTTVTCTHLGFFRKSNMGQKFLPTSHWNPMTFPQVNFINCSYKCLGRQQRRRKEENKLFFISKFKQKIFLQSQSQETLLRLLIFLLQYSPLISIFHFFL